VVLKEEGPKYQQEMGQNQLRKRPLAENEGSAHSGVQLRATRGKGRGWGGQKGRGGFTRGPGNTKNARMISVMVKTIS
jgi:hypothetical protein